MLNAQKEIPGYGILLDMELLALLSDFCVSHCTGDSLGLHLILTMTLSDGRHRPDV